MKKSSFVAIFAFVLTIAYSSALHAENTADVRSSYNRFSVGLSVDGVSGINNSFQQFVSDQFQVNLPNTRFGLSFYFRIFPEEKASLTLGLNLRNNSQSQQEVSMDWKNTRAFMDFEYAVFESKRFRLLPLVGISFLENVLLYSNNEVLSNQHTVPDILASSYTSLTLKQRLNFGVEAGVKGEFRLRKSICLSVFAKWEQSLSNGNWYVHNQKMDDMPKFANNCLSFGLMLGV